MRKHSLQTIDLGLGGRLSWQNLGRLIILSWVPVDFQQNMEEHKIVSILVIWRGKKFDVEINSGATLKEFGQKLQQLTNVQSNTMRLLIPRSSDSSSKLITPFSDEHSIISLKDSSILEGKLIRMMGVFEDEVKEVSQNGTKAEQRIAGFDEEERRLRQRMLTKPTTPLRLPKGAYIFCDFRTLHLPGIELKPPASEALKRMHMLAADPGIVSIMNKHHWRVGVMTEMAPVGYVGVSPKCILGFNKNQGEEISLRLRTDDLKGFRKYESIKQTLLHELAHMVYSEHDADFYALDKQLNQEAISLDWTRSRSHTLSGVKPSGQYEEEFYEETTGSSSQKVGGKTSDDMATARAASVAAAYHRLVVATTESVQGDGVDVEPHPDNSGCKRHEEPDEYMETEPNPGILKTEFSPELELSSTKTRIEPDPDDSGETKTVLKKVLTEPDPDDYLAIEILDEKTHLSHTDDAMESNKSGCWNFVEPDPDDSQNTELREYAKKENKFQEEPDPDDSDLEMATFKCGNRVEPDPDDAIANGIMQHNGSQATEFSEDVTMLNKMQKEPVSDVSDMEQTTENVEHDNGDSMVNEIEISQHEPDPDENSGCMMDTSSSLYDLPDQDDQELQRIQDPVSVICSRLQKTIEMLKSEVHPAETTLVVQTLFKIIRNVVEQPEELKYKRLRKANPHFQRTVAKYKAAMEILFLVGFKEDAVSDETFVVLTRNDPGLLWLAKSTLEMCIAH